MEKQFTVTILVASKINGLNTYSYDSLPKQSVLEIRDAVVNGTGIELSGAAYAPGEIRQAFWSENEGEDGEE